MRNTCGSERITANVTNHALMLRSFGLPLEHADVLYGVKFTPNLVYESVGFESPC